MMEILEDRGLSFLFPLMRIQTELTRQIRADANATVYYKWIRENVDNKLFSDSSFITILVTVYVLSFPACALSSCLANAFEICCFDFKRKQHNIYASLYSVRFYLYGTVVYLSIPEYSLTLRANRL